MSALPAGLARSSENRVRIVQIPLDYVFNLPQLQRDSIGNDEKRW
jgi:hypothetical protein